MDCRGDRKRQNQEIVSPATKNILYRLDFNFETSLVNANAVAETYESASIFSNIETSFCQRWQPRKENSKRGSFWRPTEAG